MNALAWTLVYFVCAPPAADTPILACTPQMMEAADCGTGLATATALLEPTRLLVPTGCMLALPPPLPLPPIPPPPQPRRRPSRTDPR